MTVRRELVVWLAAYLLFVAAIAAGLYAARARVLAEYGNPEAIERWRQWAEETRKPAAEDQPVARRPVLGEEPPSLVLMRDHFGVILGTSLLIGTFLFAFLVFVLRGAFRSSADAPGRASQRSGEPPRAW